MEHRSYKTHECPKSDHNSRKVVVCETCSMSIETTGRDGEVVKAMLEKHEKSGNCDPKKKKKPTCPVRRCKEILTFSNTSTCKTCQLKVCLKHRFPADHVCKKAAVEATVVEGKGRWSDRFLAAMTSRNGKDCGSKSGHGSASIPSTPSSVKAY